MARVRKIAATVGSWRRTGGVYHRTESSVDGALTARLEPEGRDATGGASRLMRAREGLMLRSSTIHPSRDTRPPREARSPRSILRRPGRHRARDQRRPPQTPEKHTATITTPRSAASTFPFRSISIGQAGTRRRDIHGRCLPKRSSIGARPTIAPVRSNRHCAPPRGLAAPPYVPVLDEPA